MRDEYGLRYTDITKESTLPHEETLESEIAATGDILLEMANLPESKTGIPGRIFISTKMASHGPLVKYFIKTGYSQPSFSVSIAAEPELLASGLPAQVTNKMSPLVIRWVALNHEALTQFWNEGVTWDDDEVTAFKARLVRL